MGMRLSKEGDVGGICGATDHHTRQSSTTGMSLQERVL